MFGNLEKCKNGSTTTTVLISDEYVGSCDLSILIKFCGDTRKGSAPYKKRLLTPTIPSFIIVKLRSRLEEPTISAAESDFIKPTSAWKNDRFECFGEVPTTKAPFTTRDS